MTGDALRKFEYTRYSGRRELDMDELNSYGKGGWELAAVVNFDREHWFTYYFKREVDVRR